MSSRRAGTLKRAKAITEADEPQHGPEPESAAPSASVDAMDRPPPETTATTAPQTDTANLDVNQHVDTNQESIDEVHDVPRTDPEAVCGASHGGQPEPYPVWEEDQHHNGALQDTSRVGTADGEEQEPCIAKHDSYVSSTTDRGNRYRVGTCNRRFLNNRSVSFNESKQMSTSTYDKEPSDKCSQYVDLCMSILKPCCGCCKTRDHNDWNRPGGGRVIKNEEDILIPEDPFRKRCLRACMTFVYVLLVLVGGVVTYSMLQDLVHSMQNPVRSIHYNIVEDYDAPGIAVYPGGAEFLACGHYYNNVVTSKVRLEQLDLVNKTCTFSNMTYRDPHYPEIERNALIIRGPTSFKKREAIFLHFALEDETRHFFTVSYFVFPGYDAFNKSADPVDQLVRYHQYMPTFALSAGLRMWIKLIMSEAYKMDDAKDTDFKVEYSVVRFVDRRPENQTKRHLFFIFFEWKNDKIEQSRLILTTTPWSIGAGLCGVFLTLHRVYQLAQTSYKRVQKDKQRRSIRKRTLRELRQRSMEASATSD